MEPSVYHRTIVLVDVENLLGSSRYAATEVASLRVTLESMAGQSPGAHFVLGASSGPALVEAGIAWPEARRVWRPGRDGADLALADVALNEGVVDRFTHVVIGSGDGIFAVVARYLKGHGINVEVIARRGGLSRQLAKTVPCVHLLGASQGRAA